MLSPSNLGIRELPAELGQLSNLWQLDIEDLNINNVPQDVRKEGTVKYGSLAENIFYSCY